MLRGFYAHHDTRTPFVLNVGENMINIVLAIVLVERWGVLGLGLALALVLPHGGGVGTAGHGIQGAAGSRCASILRSLWRMLLAAAVMARGDLARHRAPSGRTAAPAAVVADSWSAGCAGSGRLRRRLLLGVSGATRIGRLLDESAATGLPAEARDSRLRAMFKLASKWWKYLTAKLTGNVQRERADPKVQLEQAITEAQAQHRRLKEQATNVIASQKQAEMRLNAKMAELEKLNANARQALIMAADAEKAGNADKATQYNERRRDDRQPADPGRKGRREPEVAGARVHRRPPIRPRPRSHRTAACCSRRSPRSRSC